MAAGTRERIVTVSAEMFRRQGYEGTGLKQIVTAANVPFGSLYHFFPGGKEQLGAEAIRVSGGAFGRMGNAILDAAPDIVSGIRDLFNGAALTMKVTDYADACPIATVALEVSSSSEPMRQAAAEVFEDWIGDLQQRYMSAGIPADRARALAVATLSLLEGAFIFSRAMRTTQPVEIAGAAAVDALKAALRESSVANKGAGARAGDRRRRT
jgi:AcrR family transcriptional regulator